MQLILGLKLLQDVVAGFLASEDEPHGFGKINIIFKIYFLVELRLWEDCIVVFLSKFLLF